MIPSHTICPKCGFYDKQPKLKVAAPAKELETKGKPKVKKAAKK
jgi:hypothetical protein